MKNIELDFISDLKSRLKSKQALIQVVLGPRQVGKTTTIQNYLEKNYRNNEYIYETSESGLANSLWLEQIWSATRDEKILVIDEIQKVENWSQTIKKLWDENRRKKIHTKVVLLGSSSMDIQKGLSESLTGRFELIRAWHWNFEESEKAYGIDYDSYLQFGGYPASYLFLKDKERWLKYINDSIIDTVLNKDILSFSKVKSPALFRQAFYLMCGYPAQEISFNKLLGQLQDKGNIDLVKYYLELFEGAYLLKGIYKYSVKSIVTKQSSPKIIVLAPALSNTSQSIWNNQDFQGHVFESLVGSTLIREGLDLSYWRQNSKEVDFVTNYEGQLYGIEVKSGRPKNSKGLIEFKRNFPAAKGLFVTKDNFKTFSKNPTAFLKKYAVEI